MVKPFTLKGQKSLERSLAKMSNPKAVFDNDVRDVAIKGHTELVKTNPKMTGNTARAWIAPKKKGLSEYVVTNTVTTPDGKYSLPIMLNDGRGEITPKRAKKLYIPLSNKGRSKRLGAAIPKSFKYGVDYILADKAKAVKGTGFIDKTLDKMGKLLASKMIKTIRTVHGG